NGGAHETFLKIIKFPFRPIMPVKYVGRLNRYKCKRLFDILCNLKDLGVGRVVYRDTRKRFFPNEPSYVRITEAVPDYSKPDVLRGTVWGEVVFRGQNEGIKKLTLSTHKPDWVLLPKEEEEAFCSHDAPAYKPNVVPSKITYPPLLKAMVVDELERKGEHLTEEPMLDLQVVQHWSKNKKHGASIYDTETHILEDIDNQRSAHS
ncbi:unnamed protein product, partial [Owenia fusiformis]